MPTLRRFRRVRIMVDIMSCVRELRVEELVQSNVTG